MNQEIGKALRCKWNISIRLPPFRNPDPMLHTQISLKKKKKKHTQILLKKRKINTRGGPTKPSNKPKKGKQRTIAT